MDRLLREGNPPAGQLASPKPQYKKPGVDEYAPVEGQHGAPFATLKDASGNIISPATEDKLEQVRQLLTGVATEAKLEQARVLLNTISNKDFATQATLEVVQSELALIKSELEAIKANQISGDQKVTLSGNIVSEKYVTLANAEEVRSANVSYRLITHGGLTEELIRKYRSFKISITSTLDKEITVNLYSIPRSSGASSTEGMIIYSEESAVKVGDLGGVVVISPKAGGVGAVDRWKVIPALEGVVHSNLSLYLVFVGGAPTSGSLTIGVEMHG